MLNVHSFQLFLETLSSLGTALKVASLRGFHLLHGCPTACAAALNGFFVLGESLQRLFPIEIVHPHRFILASGRPLRLQLDRFEAEDAWDVKVSWCGLPTWATSVAGGNSLLAALFTQGVPSNTHTLFDVISSHCGMNYRAHRGSPPPPSLHASFFTPQRTAINPPVYARHGCYR